ncbi:MAG: hypothetical protein ACOH2R_13315 [Pseudomonas sp.]
MSLSWLGSRADHRRRKRFRIILAACAGFQVLSHFPADRWPME